MSEQRLYEGTPTAAIQAALGGPLGAGRLGLLVARPGVGKTALLVHLALEQLLTGHAVLHVALRDSVEHVRAHYDEALRTAIGAGLRDAGAAALSVERHRMIHSWLDRGFDPSQLRAHLKMLSELAQFEPKMLAIDGLDERVDFGALAALVHEIGLPTWATVRSLDGEIPTGARAAATAVLNLFPAGRTVGLQLARPGGAPDQLPVALDCNTLLVASATASEEVRPHRDVTPADCTLLSGGANGAEAAFGVAAERWGVRESNFTFEGHKQVRERGRHLLSPRELAAGDVSLVYVSKRLNRTYANESGLIKKVLQTLWHMVSRAQQVFVVGQIMEDGTVVGGTGWSVELARMWNREVWVFDQDRTAWFRWDGVAWVPGSPAITAAWFCGTGTRYLTTEGQSAIDALFDRSFGRAAD
jgi:hypothetical protein